MITVLRSQLSPVCLMSWQANASSRPSGSSGSLGTLGTWVPWLEKVNTSWSPGFEASTIEVSAVITFFLVASLSRSTVMLRAVKPSPLRALVMSLASLTQPLSQLLIGSDLNSLMPTQSARRAMIVPFDGVFRR